MEPFGLSCNDLKFFWEIEPIKKEEARLKVLIESEIGALKRIFAEREKNTNTESDVKVVQEERKEGCKGQDFAKSPVKLDDIRQENVLRLRCERRRKKLACLRQKKLDILWNFVKDWLEIELNRLSIEPCLKNNPSVAKLAEFYSRSPIDILDEERVWKSVEDIMKSCKYLPKLPKQINQKSERCTTYDEVPSQDALRWIDINKRTNILNSEANCGVLYQGSRGIAISPSFEDEHEEDENELYVEGHVSDDQDETVNEHILLSIMEECHISERISTNVEHDENVHPSAKTQNTINAQDMSTLHGQNNHAFARSRENNANPTSHVEACSIRNKIAKTANEEETSNNLRLNDPGWKVEYMERVASSKCPWKKNREAIADWELARKLQLEYEPDEIVNRFDKIEENHNPPSTGKERLKENDDHEVKSLRFTLTEEAQIPSCSDKMQPTVTTTSSSPGNPTLTVSTSQTRLCDGRSVRRQQNEKSPRFSKNRVQKGRKPKKSHYNNRVKYPPPGFKAWHNEAVNHSASSLEAPQTPDKNQTSASSGALVVETIPETSPPTQVNDEISCSKSVPSLEGATASKFSFFTDPILLETTEQTIHVGNKPNAAAETTHNSIVPPLDLGDLSDAVIEGKTMKCVTNVSETYNNTIILADGHDAEHQFKTTVTTDTSKSIFVDTSSKTIGSSEVSWSTSFFDAAKTKMQMFDESKAPNNAFDFTFQGGMIAGPKMPETPQHIPEQRIFPPKIPFRVHRPTKTAQCMQVPQISNTQFPTTYQPYGEAWFKALSKTPKPDTWITQPKIPEPTVPVAASTPVQYPTPITSSPDIWNSNEIAANHIKRILKICDEEQTPRTSQQNPPMPIKMVASTLSVLTGSTTTHQNYAPMPFRNRFPARFVSQVPNVMNSQAPTMMNSQVPTMMNSQRVCLVRPQCVQNAAGDAHARAHSSTQINPSHVYAPPFTPGASYRHPDRGNLAREDPLQDFVDDTDKNLPSFFPSSCVFDASLGI